MTTVDQPFKLPVIRAVRLSDFDLYKKQPNAEVTIEKPVFCLIGANGLGKSTFLSTLNFGITGAIPDPDRTFRSANEYRVEASKSTRAKDYFSGRISETKRPLATVTVELAWESTTIVITRYLCSEDGACRMEITRGKDVEVLSTESGDDVEKGYQMEVLRETNIPNFAQFTFLFHFVLTFDEGRHLIMWDDRAITTALYLAFGSDDAAAAEAEKLGRSMERESSRARNVRFAAKAVKDKIKQLERILEGGESDSAGEAELIERFEAMTKAVQNAANMVRNKAAEREAADLQWADISASVTDKQMQYRQLFAERVGGVNVIEYHPAVRSSISQDCCAVCQTHGVGSGIEERVLRSECPLCASIITQQPEGNQILERLKDLDAEILELRKELENILLLRQRLGPEHSSAEDSLLAARTALEFFLEGDGNKLSLEKPQGSAWLNQEVGNFSKEYDRLNKQAKDHRKKRDEIHNELRQVEKNLRERYDRASETFVPRFRQLAEQFIGLPIDVDIEQRTGAEAAGFRLKLTIDGQLRLSAERLSESQRFFVDIALRMALSESITGGASSLLIDTPEGSLDIAYEARAGQMFDTFARAGNYILMTANLRSSELLVNLAHLRGKAGMSIVRMTEWAELTDVQAAEEVRLDKAFKVISDALA